MKDNRERKQNWAEIASDHDTDLTEIWPIHWGAPNQNLLEGSIFGRNGQTLILLLYSGIVWGLPRNSLSSSQMMLSLKVLTAGGYQLRELLAAQ